MKKAIKRIGTIVAMGIMLVLAYWLGTTQAETVTEVQTVTEVREIVPNDYIDINSAEFQDNFVNMRTVVDFSTTEYGLQLYFEDGTGYYWEW